MYNVSLVYPSHNQNNTPTEAPTIGMYSFHVLPLLDIPFPEIVACERQDTKEKMFQFSP